MKDTIENYSKTFCFMRQESRFTLSNTYKLILIHKRIIIITPLRASVSGAVELGSRAVLNSALSHDGAFSVGKSCLVPV
jgi:hypothetical protein